MAPPDDVQSENILHGRVASPFSQAEANLASRGPAKNRTALWVVLSVALTLAMVAGGFILVRIINDPLRTMEEFPTGKYFENYHSLAGSRFKGDLRVEADIGWKEGVGRMMLFSTPSDSRSFAVLIPASLPSIYFVKGQTYLAELQVKEGGLVYANSCRKN